MSLSIALAAAAGLASSLSPCILPILPVVLATAAAQHRLAPVALATGLAASFTALGLFVASLGFSIGLDEGVVRVTASTLVLAIGVVLLVPALQARLSLAGAPVAAAIESRFAVVRGRGLLGQFGIGALLGAVWIPCVGPTLGAATLLAARGVDLGEAALVMATFGIFAALPLACLGLLSRETILRLRGDLARTGAGLRKGLGLSLVAIATLVLTGLDKMLEGVLLGLSPDWLVAFTTAF